MSRACVLVLIGCLAAAFAPTARADETIVEVTPDPATVRLVGPKATFSLLVHGKTAEGTLLDLTRTARYLSKNTQVAQVGPTGIIRAVGDGTTEIEVEAGGRT